MKVVVLCILAHTLAVSLQSAIGSSEPGSKERKRIQAWVDWKNQGRRYDFHFNALPGRLMPEHESYAEGLYMRGLGFYALAVAYALGLAVFLVLRLRFRVWGAQSVKNEYFTPSRRQAPGLLCGLGFLIYLSGGVVLLTGSHQAHLTIQTGIKATVDTALLTCSVLLEMKQALVTTNMQHSGAKPRFYINTAFLTEPTHDALEVAERTKQLQADAEQWERRRLVLTFVLFCLGFVLFTVALLGFLLKVESMLFCFGVSTSVLGVLATVLYGLYAAELVGSADYCEAVLSCVYDSVLPKEAQGLGVFYRDFSSSSRVALIQGHQDIGLAHTRTLSEINSRLQVLYNLSLPSPPDLSLLNSDPDIDTQLWARTAQVLSVALEVMCIQDLASYQKSHQVLEYCREIETQVCGSLMDELYLGFMGLVIVSTGFSIAVCGGFAAPRVIERWRREEQQRHLGKYNFYGT